jgi:hypothetical protein
VYSFDGRTENLLGLGAEGRRSEVSRYQEEQAFLGTHVTVLRNDGSTWAVACNSTAAGTLVVVFTGPGEGPGGRRAGATADGTLCAWLVRPSGEMFRRYVGGSGSWWLEDPAVLRRLVDDPASAVGVPGAIPLDGTARVELRPEGLGRMTVDLRTRGAMPVHVEFLRYVATARPGGAAEAAEARRLMDRPASGPATIKGTFRGGYHGYSIPI